MEQFLQFTNASTNNQQKDSDLAKINRLLRSYADESYVNELSLSLQRRLHPPEPGGDFPRLSQKPRWPHL